MEEISKIKYDSFIAELDAMFLSANRVLADMPPVLKDADEALACDTLHSYLKSVIAELEFLDQRAIDRSDAYHSKQTAAKILNEDEETLS